MSGDAGVNFIFPVVVGRFVDETALHVFSSVVSPGIVVSCTLVAVPTDSVIFGCCILVVVVSFVVLFICSVNVVACGVLVNGGVIVCFDVMPVC